MKGWGANPCSESECDNFIVARQQIGMHIHGTRTKWLQIKFHMIQRKKTKSHCIESTDRMISANRQLSTHFSSTTKGSLRFSMQFSEYINRTKIYGNGCVNAFSEVASNSSIVGNVEAEPYTSLIIVALNALLMPLSNCDSIIHAMGGGRRPIWP